MSMHPPRDPDELASDLVDGLLPEGEAARLRNDPAIAARVEAIQAARAALRVPPPSSTGAVDRAVAATFAALDRATLPMAGATDTASPSGERPPPPVPLRPVGPPVSDPAAAGGPWAPAHSSGQSGRSRRSSEMRWLAAAAAIVLLGLVTVGILSSSDAGDQDQSSSDVAASAAPDDDAQAGGSADHATEEGQGEASPSDESAATTAGDAPTAATEPGVDSGTGDTTAPPEGPVTTGNNLGTVDSPAELADRIRSRTGPLGAASGEGVFDDHTAGSDGDGGSGGSECAGRTAAGDPARGDAVYAADAVYAGEPVLVHVYDVGDGKLQLVATNASCVDVVDMPFSG